MDNSRIGSKTTPFSFENGLVWAGPQTSYHFVFIFKHFVSLVVGVLSLTRLTKLSVQLCCVGRRKWFVGLSGNQFKISDVCKVLFSLSLLEPSEKIYLLCGAETRRGKCETIILSVVYTT